jgi:hypothetical protein
MADRKLVFSNNAAPANSAGVASGAQFNFDGIIATGDTFIKESSANVLDLHAGNSGANTLRVTSSGIVVTGTTNITGVLSLAGYQAVKNVAYGYSASYLATQVGAPGTNAGSVALSIDPSTIAGGAFSGQNQVVIGHNGILFANNAGTNWIGCIARNTSDQILIGPLAPSGITSGPLTVSTTGLTITGTVSASAASGAFTGLQVGTGGTTTTGLIIGNHSSGVGAIWSTAVTPSTTNHAFAATATATGLNVATGGTIVNNINNSTITTVSSTGLAVTGTNGIQLASTYNVSWGGVYGAGVPTITGVTSTGLNFYPTGSTSGIVATMTATGLSVTGTTTSSGIVYANGGNAASVTVPAINITNNKIITFLDSGGATTNCGFLWQDSSNNFNIGAGNSTRISIAAATGLVTLTNGLTVGGNLIVNGTTVTVNSTTMTVDDPIITLGGDIAPVADDNKDRGVEFRWHNGSAAKVGFFGYDDSTGYLTFIPEATNTSEVFSGTMGDIQATNFRGNLIGTSSTLSSLIAPVWNVNRSTNTANGISWYNSSTYTAWADYMAQAAQTSTGPTANITAPSGTLVTSWAQRRFIENAAGYGWTFESGTFNTSTPSVVAEIASATGFARFGGVGVGAAPTATNMFRAHSTTASSTGFYSTIQATTGTNYGGDFEASGVGATKNVGGFFHAAGATTNYAIEVNAGDSQLKNTIVTGTLGVTGVSSFAAGAVGAPSIYLSTDTTTGLYRIGANNLGVAVSGSKVLDIASTGLAITGTGSTTLTLGTNVAGPTPRQAITILNDGYAAPSNANATSNGDKFVWWNSATVKYALGAESNGSWLQCTGIPFRIYTGASTSPVLSWTIAGDGSITHTPTGVGTGMAIGETFASYEGWDKQLNIHGASHSRLTVKTASVRMGVYAHDSWNTIAGSALNGYVGTYTNHAVGILTNTTVKAVVHANGAVGIGFLTAPSGMLEVQNSTTTWDRSFQTVTSGARTAGSYGAFITNSATSSTASISKAGLVIDSSGTWNGSGSTNIGLQITATGGTANTGIYINVGTGANDYNDISIGGNSGWSVNESHGINFVAGTTTVPILLSRFDTIYNTDTSASFRWKSLYYAGARTATVMTLTSKSATTADLTLVGTLYATAKSFKIDHPTKPGKKLVHGSLEGPENGVYIRGRTKDGIIYLPEYWVGLVDENSITVQLTAIGNGQKLYVDNIEDNKVYIGNDNLINKAIDCFYFIQAERKDVAKLEVVQ